MTRLARRTTPLALPSLALGAGLVAAAAAARPLRAQNAIIEPVADTGVALRVTLDHPDWLYRVGETARFRVTLRRDGRPVPGARVVVTVGPARRLPGKTDTLDLSRGEATLPATSARPDFVRLTARAQVDGRAVTALATAGFGPEGLTSPVEAPADFDEFWRRAIADARKVPLEPVLTRMPARSTPEVDVYHVSFQNYRVGSRLYGILSVPTKPGRYPAMLVVPGAGVRPYFPSVATARKGVVHLAIGIHGIPVDRDSLLYNELRATALQRYYTYNLDDRDEYYYKRVFVGVVRAADFLLALPQVDSTRFVVQGGSQGGGLSLVAAALDPRVRAIAVSYPAMGDQLGYFQGRAGGWPHLFADTTRMRAVREKLETVRYYDAVNFARRVRVPGIYAWGFNDDVVPPTSSYAAYNAVTAPKEKILAPEMAHARNAAQMQRMDAWLLERLGVEDGH